ERISYLEKLLNMHIDPVGSADTAVIAVGGALFGITLIFIIIAWINRNFRPIRAKNLPMVTCLFVTGVLWFVGDIPMNGHVLLKGAFSNCKELNIWLHVLFCFLYTSVLVIRCFALDRVFNQSKPTHGAAYYVPSVVLCLFYLCYSIVTQAMPNNLTIGYDSDMEMCVRTNGYQYVTVGVMWINWLIFIFMMFRLRNIQQTFNEFYESLLICALGIAAMVKTSVVHFTHPKYPLVLGFRVAETVGDSVVCSGVILIIIAYPVIRSVYKPKEYEGKWIMRLRTDGMQDTYEANMKLRGDGPLNYRPMSGLRPFSAEMRANEGVDGKSQYLRMNDYGNEKIATVVMHNGGPYATADNMRTVSHHHNANMGEGDIGDLAEIQMHLDRRSLDSMQMADEGSWSRRIL
ncbi:hypothetical protein EV179_006322, partial [Coemansia sp. RSA 487]